MLSGCTAPLVRPGQRPPRSSEPVNIGRFGVRTFLAFLSVYLIWGSTFLGIRIAIESIPPFLMVGVRWTVAGSLFYVLLRWRGAPGPRPSDWRLAAILGGGIIVAGNGTVTYAEQFIPSGTVAVIVAMVPAMMALLGWWSGVTTRPRSAVWVGIALASSGVVIVMAPGAAPRQHWPTILLLVIAELIWSAASLYAARSRQTTSPFVMAAMQMLCAGVIMVIVAGIHGEFHQLNISTVTTRSLLALLYLALIGSIVGFSAYLWLLRNVDSTKVATYAFVNPIVAVFLGWLVIGERVGSELISGSVLVVFGVALIIFFRPKAIRTVAAKSLVNPDTIPPQLVP